MNENKINYYAIIPATVRYDNELTDKAKLLYGEITCLCNKQGYCFATNNYFANLYSCTNRVIQLAISKLQEKGYIKIIIENNCQRKIYLSDAIGYEKNFIPTHENNFIGRYEKNFTHNNINNNIDDDDLFYIIIKDKSKIPKDFLVQLERLEFVYTEETLKFMSLDNIQKLKEIIYTVYSIYKGKFKYLITKFDRKTLIDLYNNCKEHTTKDFINYYKQAIINKYTN